jgi:hypothetical protein
LHPVSLALAKVAKLRFQPFLMFHVHGHPSP